MLITDDTPAHHEGHLCSGFQFGSCRDQTMNTANQPSIYDPDRISTSR